MRLRLSFILACVAFFLASTATTSSAQSIADTYSFPLSIRSAGIHGVVDYSYIPPRADTSGWITFPSRVDVRAFRSAPTTSRRGDTLVWTADSTFTSVDGNHVAFQNAITLVVDTLQRVLTSIGVSVISNESQQAYQTDRTRMYTFVGRFPYVLSDTALTVTLTGPELRAAVRSIGYADRTTAVLQGQLSATFITGFDTVAIDDTARLTITLAKLRPASVPTQLAPTGLLTYPNPADRFIVVPAQLARILDLSGRTVLTPTTQLDNATLRVDVSGLASGTYLLESGGRHSLFTVQHR